MFSIEYSMKEFRVILWTLYACVTAVVFSITFFAFIIFPLILNIHDLEEEWGIELSDIVKENNVAWSVLMSPDTLGYHRRRRQNSDLYVNNNEIVKSLSFRPQYNEQEKNTDGFPAPHQLYNYRPEKPEFGYGYAKLRCCCSLHDNPLNNKNLKLSYKCPIGVPGPQGPSGIPGNDGIDGEGGPDGVDYPIAQKYTRRENYGIRSQFSNILPPQAINCGSCPNGPPGGPGLPGIPGQRGIKGVPGSNGRHGMHGKSGPPGPLGDTGLRGRPGMRGADGARGIDGVKGAIGPKGIKGTLGATGARGSTGANGPTGIVGRYGPRGDPGPPGIKGQRGMDGSDGMYGPPGAPGQDALYCKCPIRSQSIETAKKNKERKSFEGTYPANTFNSKYLVENSHPPSTAPKMPSYYIPYHSNQQFEPTVSANYQINNRKANTPSNIKIYSRNEISPYDTDPQLTVYGNPSHIAIKNRERFLQTPTIKIRTVDTTMLTIAPTPPPIHRTTYNPQQLAATTLKTNSPNVIGRYAQELPTPDSNDNKYDISLSEDKNERKYDDSNAQIAESYDDDMPFEVNENWHLNTPAENGYSKKQRV